MTKGSRRFTPHPLLSTGQRELYMQVSRDVTWYRVKTIMEPIGDVKCVEKVVDKEGNQRLRIRFEDVYHAEMALATLNTCTKVLRNSGIREEIRFSHTPRMESAMPEEPICRQYLKGNLSIVNNQTLFEWFRQAGPLVMCRIQDDIPVVQYWREMDAEFARQNFRKFHFKLQRNASLKLLTFSPFCVVAKNLPQQVVSSRMKEVFSLYGEIIHWRLLNQREEGYRCYVSYSEEHEAQAACRALNGADCGGRKLHVAFFEPLQDDFQLLEAEDFVRTPHQLTDAYRKRRLVELQRDREVAERAHKNAHQCTRAVKQAEREAEEGLRQASTAQRMACEAAAEAKAAMLKAKMAYDVAKGICEEEEYRVGNAQISYGQALRRRKEATMRRANAENAELDCQAERERVERKEEVLKGSIFEEAEEDSVDDQNTQAEKRRYEQHKKEREALQERKERAKTEVKGLEEMLRVLEKSDPSEPDKNKPETTYKIAFLKERIRCKQRDLSWYEELDASDEERAIARFTQISSDFDIIKFGSSQPLTPDSVPWPNLSSPDDPPSRFIDWETVENFFSAAKRSLGPGEYKSLVEQTHRRFHPDKWRSRGLFATVLNEELRTRLEEGVNIVSQAITPLWQRSRA